MFFFLKNGSLSNNPYKQHFITGLFVHSGAHTPLTECSHLVIAFTLVFPNTWSRERLARQGLNILARSLKREVLYVPGSSHCSLFEVK